MIEDRRNFLARMAPLAIVAPFGFLSTTRAEQDGTAGPERHRQSQQPGLPEEPLPQIDSKEILKHNQQQIQDDIKKLYALAGELNHLSARMNRATATM